MLNLVVNKVISGP